MSTKKVGLTSAKGLSLISRGKRLPNNYSRQWGKRICAATFMWKSSQSTGLLSPKEQKNL